MNVKAVKKSFAEAVMDGWNTNEVEKIVELKEDIALLLRYDYNCMLINKLDGSFDLTDKLDKAFNEKIREFTFEEFEKFLETELRKAT